MAFNFVGPQNGEGIVVYCDGAECKVNQNKQHPNTYEAGSGEIVIGKYNDIYSSLMMDELLFFNRKLNLKEIEILYNTDEWLKNVWTLKYENEQIQAQYTNLRITRHMAYFSE